MKCLLAFILVFWIMDACSQTDTSVFTRISSEMSGFKPNFSNPPEDKLTSAIRQLRSLRGGFNINEALAFKLAQDRHEGKLTLNETSLLEAYLLKGEGAAMINNAVTWMYRKHFTYNETRKLIKFYKTSAGQKLNREFPVLMLQSLMVAETVKEKFNTDKTRENAEKNSRQ